MWYIPLPYPQVWLWLVKCPWIVPMTLDFDVEVPGALRRNLPRSSHLRTSQDICVIFCCHCIFGINKKKSKDMISATYSSINVLYVQNCSDISIAKLQIVSVVDLWLSTTSLRRHWNDGDWGNYPGEYLGYILDDSIWMMVVVYLDSISD